MKKIAFISSVPYALDVFMRENISSCARYCQVSLITSPKDIKILNNLNAKLISSDIKRKPSLLTDAILFIHLIRLFRQGKYDLIHSITPKAGFFSMLIGWLCRVPIRVHSFTGQVWFNKTGLNRFFLKCCDRMIVLFSTHILVDSPSQLTFLKKERVLTKGIVIGKGSICGVNSKKFHPNVSTRIEIRKKLKIRKNDKVILFIGRLNADKGILDLAKAFMSLLSEYNNIFLVIVGQEENITHKSLENFFEKHMDRVRLQGFTNTPEKFMAAADVFCLPSYREGFGQVLIEAAASGLPSIATKIYGITDAIEDKKSGILVPVNDTLALRKALLQVLFNKSLSRKMGNYARQRALKFFSSKFVASEMKKFYKNTLKSCNS